MATTRNPIHVANRLEPLPHRACHHSPTRLTWPRPMPPERGSWARYHQSRLDCCLAPPTAPDRTSTVLAAVCKPAGATESVEAGFAVAVIDDEDRAIERL